jgi:ATP-dependent helicase/nuclease subunit B
MLKEYKPLLFQGFMAHFNNDENAFLKGKNYLSFEMANELITQFLKSEKENLLKNTDKSLYIIGLEANLNTSITLNLNGEQKAVNIKGFIDRIDKWDNQLRIIDYKSGKISDNDVSRKKINSENEIEQLLTFCKNSKYIFQLLTYAYLYHQSKKEIPHQSAIYSLINYKKNPFNLQIGDYSMEKLVDIYPQLLELALREIYDKDLPFEHNEKAKYCSYCN